MTILSVCFDTLPFRIVGNVQLMMLTDRFQICLHFHPHKTTRVQLYNLFPSLLCAQSRYQFIVSEILLRHSRSSWIIIMEVIFLKQHQVSDSSASRWMGVTVFSTGMRTEQESYFVIVMLLNLTSGDKVFRSST